MAAAEKRNRYKSYRQTHLNRLTEAAQIAERAGLDASLVPLFEEYCHELNKMRDQFYEAHNTVIGLITSEENTFEAEDAVRKQFDTIFFSVKMQLTRLSKPKQPNETDVLSSKIPLPQVELPTFSGDILQFSSYIEMFDSLVGNNPKLSDIEKFNYLLSSLKGSALQVIKSLPMTSANYKIAYAALIKRFKNIRVIATAHWSAIDNAAKLNSDNPTELRNLLDIFADNLAALQNLKFPVDQWDLILVHLLLKKLDVPTVTQFELYHNSSNVPAYTDLYNFLSKRCTALDNLSFSRKVNNKPVKSFCKSTTSLLVEASESPLLKCSICGANHQVYKCPELLRHSPTERFRIIKSKNACINCLSNAHATKKCQSSQGCHKCGQKHHTLLHFSNSANSKSPVGSSAPPGGSASLPLTTSTSQENVAFVNTAFSQNPSSVFLATAKVEVRDSRGDFQVLRCLIDTGSMISLISKRSMQRLGLQPGNSSIKIQGLDSMHSFVQNGDVSLSIRPINQTGPLLSVEAMVINKICENLPYHSVSAIDWSHLSDLRLADPQFNCSGPIDILLGVDVFTKILLDGRATGKDGEPIAVNTIFGYVIMGKYRLPNKVAPAATSLFCATLSHSLEDEVKKFWEIEDIPQATSMSSLDSLCEKIYTDTTIRIPNGRFSVDLPFKNEVPSFPNSRDLAIQRYLSLEKRLLRQPDVYKEYQKFMQEYLDLNHMTRALPPNTMQSYYIPHFCIFKPDSLSTKLRVVFNASAKRPGQFSLNDHLLVGPKLQQDITTLLLNFRLFPYVLTADIKMMYRQILVSPHHRDFQRIIWRFSPEEPLQDFTLNTVTYGVTSSPFLAIRTLLYLADSYQQEFPKAAQALRTCTYVDDLVISCSSREIALATKSQIISLLAKGCFELRKWSSNDPTLVADLPPSHLSIDDHYFDHAENLSLKVLGLHWVPSSDSFRFSCQATLNRCTKRNLLSALARIFDPLGILSPLTFLIKHLIQQIWTHKLGWDEEPPSYICRLWEQYKEEFSCLSNFSLPRQIAPDSFESCELHCFGDASEKGYCAISYFVFFLPNGTVSTYFVCAKSKVAPLKKLSLPRLELCAAVLAARLVAYIFKLFQHQINISRIFCWSDSRITLSWIKSEAHRWKTFVCNRVSYIQERVSPENWFYVPSAQNPADIGSRGLLPSELLHCRIWWAGPTLLTSPNRNWDSQTTNQFSPVILEEERKTIVTLATAEPNFLQDLLERFSSLNTSQRILAYVRRFIYNCKNHSNKGTGCLTSEELHSALLVFAKHSQSDHFLVEIEALQKSKRLPKPFQKLAPFIDKEGLIRVGGRLRHAPIPFHRKFPALLPSRCLLTERLVQFIHRKYLHATIQTTQCILAQTFWIISSKRVIRRILSKCFVCWKTNPQTFPAPLMGDLPSARVSRVKCFLHTGVDYAGPFKISMSRHRGAKCSKAYICLFVCMATKAVHLELASDLSTEAFLAALKRFVARRGRCSHIYSDRGTNFVGAIRQLNDVMANAASQEHISWSLNPAYAPNFGSLWESSIKNVKTHLIRVVGEQILTYEEFLTILVQIEAVVNSRPLGPLTTDPNDLGALTPGHFLTCDTLNCLPEEDVSQIPINRLSRWQLLSRLHQHFWDRWSREYLHTLQQRQKWTLDQPPIKLDALVPIKSDNLPPLQGSLGRVSELFPGEDGRVRVAAVHTMNGVVRRPITKLCPLPIDDS